MKRAIQTSFEGAHSLSSVDANLEFLLAAIPVKWVTSPQPSAGRPRKDGRWPVHRPTPPLMSSWTVMPFQEGLAVRVYGFGSRVDSKPQTMCCWRTCEYLSRSDVLQSSLPHVQDALIDCERDSLTFECVTQIDKCQHVHCGILHLCGHRSHTSSTEVYYRGKRLLQSTASTQLYCSLSALQPAR